VGILSECLSCCQFVFERMQLAMQNSEIPVLGRDVNGSDTDGYCRYCICFHIFYRIRIRTRIVSDTNIDSNYFGYEYEYMCIEYGVNRMRIMSGTDVYSDTE
jgi:hypothetical protein